MPKMIQIRNVPDDVHRILKARAALEGKPLSEYLLADLKQSAARPTVRELRERLHQRAPVQLSIPPADLIRAEREGR
jgi:plasmid stability protein